MLKDLLHNEIHIGDTVGFLTENDFGKPVLREGTVKATRASSYVIVADIEGKTHAVHRNEVVVGSRKESV